MRTRKPYPPICAAGWNARLEFLAQAEAHLSSPDAARPDFRLLESYPHGPIKKVWTEFSATGTAIICFRINQTNPRPSKLPPEAFLLMDLLLCFGGGLSANDNGSGLRYLKLFGGNDRIIFPRIMLDAGLGEFILQGSENGRRTDHYHMHPEWHPKAAIEEMQAKVGRPVKVPFRGREDAISTAVRYFRKNQYLRPQIRITDEAFISILRRALRLLDAAREQLQDLA